MTYIKSEVNTHREEIALAENRKKPKHGSKPVAFRIPKNVLDRLDTVAANKFTSRNKLVTEILNNALPKRPARPDGDTDEQPTDNTVFS